MANRPNQSQESRVINSYGPQYRIDISNPQMGGYGQDVYKMYAVTKEGNVQIGSFSEGGTYRLQATKSMEITAGVGNDPGAVDITIQSLKGDITITAQPNGSVRIRGANITIQSDSDIDMIANNNINLKSKMGTINLDGNKVSCEGLDGNLVSATVGTFAEKIWDGSKLMGSDRFSGENPAKTT